MRELNTHYGNKPKEKPNALTDDGNNRHLSALSHKKPLESELTRPIPTLFGTPAAHRAPGHVRILFQNVRGIPKSSLDPTNHAWSSRLSAYRTDVALLSEVNANWSAIPHEDQLAVRCKEYWATTRCQVAWNKHHDKDSTHLQGGTATLAIGNISHQSTTSGTDPSGLGRWSWMLFRGPNGAKIITVSAYAPPKTKFSSNSVAGQHVSHLRATDDDRSAQSAFFDDLAEAIKTWTASGFAIVLGMDANVDVECASFNTWHRNLGLTNPLLQAYDPSPATYERGSRPINTILSSIDIEVSRGGLIS